MKPSFRRWLLGFSVLVLFAIALPACNSESPSLPGAMDETPSLEAAASASELVENLRAALEARDVELMATSLHRDFVLRLDPTYVAVAELEYGTLSRAEFLAALENLASDQPVKNDDEPLAPVTGMNIDVLEPVGDGWIPASGDRDDHAVFEREHHLAMTVSFSDAADLEIDGEVVLQAVVRSDTLDGGDSRECWWLIALADDTFPLDGALDAPNLGALWRNYLGNQAPKAVVRPDAAQVLVEQTLVLSAAASGDPEDDLAAQPFRWRLDADSDWTGWTSDPEINVTYETAGEHTVTLEVRDSEGMVADATSAVQAYRYQAPTHPDSVAANYADNYEDMFVGGYDAQLHEDFRFVKTDGGIWDRDQEMHITENIFTGQPGQDNNGYPVPPVQAINMMLDPQNPWEEIVPEHPIFGGYTGLRRQYYASILFERPSAPILRVEGLVAFYVAEVQANDRTEYRLLGFEDFTGDGPGPTEEVSWTAVKGLFQ